jgi:hypothetical protein
MHFFWKKEAGRRGWWPEREWQRLGFLLGAEKTERGREAEMNTGL